MKIELLKADITGISVDYMDVKKNEPTDLPVGALKYKGSYNF
jgi:hypothetical protein